MFVVSNVRQIGLFRDSLSWTQPLIFFSIVRHASTPCRTPAPRGMASQHLWTFEGVSLKKVPANKVLFGGTVPANSLFELNNKVSVPLKNVEEGIFQVWLVKRLFRFVLVRAECVGLFTILVQT